jgi:hypothetical protein
LNGGDGPPVAVSSAAPCFNKQAGQSPASAPAGSGVPHCGHLFPSGMGWFNFTVSIPASEAKPEGCYRIIQPGTPNIEHRTSNIESGQFQ